ncbi:MAG: RNA polymerase factor sigma-54 [Cytophagales bacterium]
MQKLSLNQALLQKLSPQQIQFIKLLQVTTAELEGRIEEELEANPALEDVTERDDFESLDKSTSDNEDSEYDNEYENDDLNLDDYLNDDMSGYKMQGDGGGSDEDDREMPLSSENTLYDSLEMQLSFLKLSDREHQIGIQIIGSIDNDGYLRRELDSLANDLAFSQNIETDSEELESILFKIQTFDPAGIGARNLQECLHLQLKRIDDEVHPEVFQALEIIDEYFEEFTKKHFDKIQKKLNLSDDELKVVIKMITKLNPKPGGGESGSIASQYIIPDFILTNTNGKLDLSLNSKNAPELRVSDHYKDMFDTYDKSDKKDKQIKEAVTFVKQKLDAAKWFIDAIKQRQNTLLKTMNSIISFQYDFFLDGDETKLKPMILKDIATEIGMDISTVSRVANSKSVQTEHGIYPLKFFFSEGIATDSGEDVSSREIKSILKDLIDKEDKSKPLPDEKLEKLLNDKGYNIARRTVAKYREQMDIPVARLRKEL